MKIMVFDVPAESGGALSILETFYREVINHDDKSIQWIFVLSKPVLQETENIKVLRFSWIKKSWLHRIYFDQVLAPSIVKKNQPDRIFSLQNVTVPNVDVEQITYVHQPLPFIEYKFGFKENRLYWVYQNIVSKVIYRSIKKSKKVIVQTNWLKSACIEKTGIDEKKIKVVAPKINIHIKTYFASSERTLSTFFYPAGSSYYKNHRIIVEACQKLMKRNYNRHRIIFTLKGNENSHIAELYQIVQKNHLPIEFIGSISREEVFKYYSKSVLIFPSYIETFGLPILESKMHRGIILIAHTAFSHEILDNYSNTHYFNAFDSDELAHLIEQMSNGSLKYLEDITSKDVESEDLINQILL